MKARVREPTIGLRAQLIENLQQGRLGHATYLGTKIQSLDLFQIDFNLQALGLSEFLSSLQGSKEKNCPLTKLCVLSVPSAVRKPAAVAIHSFLVSSLSSCLILYSSANGALRQIE